MTRQEERVEAQRYVRGYGTLTFPQLLGCSDGKDYFVKFKDNPIGPYSVANEWICYRLAEHVGLPIPPANLVWVTQQFIDATPALSQVTEEGTLPQAGIQFGSQRVDYAQPFTSESQIEILAETFANHDALAGIALFDRWILNWQRHPADLLLVMEGTESHVMMIDHSHAFGVYNHSGWAADLRAVESKTAKHFLDKLARPDELTHWSRVIAAVDDTEIQRIVGDMPDEWNIPEEERRHLAAYLCDRKNRLAP